MNNYSRGPTQKDIKQAREFLETGTINSNVDTRKILAFQELVKLNRFPGYSDEMTISNNCQISSVLVNRMGRALQRAGWKPKQQQEDSIDACKI